MANEKRLISADPIYNGIALYLAENAYLNDTAQSALEMVGKLIIEAPTVDAVEVVHGRWIRMDAHKGIEQFKCSVCRSECYVPTCMNEPMYDYCPNCGAKMDGERKCNEKETT